VSASTQIRALAGGDAALAALEVEREEIRKVVREVLVERVASGYLDAPAHELEQIAGKVAVRVKPALQRLVFATHMAARDYDTPPGAHEAPTAKIATCPRCGQPVAVAGGPDGR
jgi:hypothetical protein